MLKIARYTALGALFLVPFLPLYVAGELFFPFITGKAFAFRILVEIAVAAWIVLALLDTRYRPRFSWTLALFGILTLWMLIADLFGVNPHKAIWSNFERMEGWITLIHLFGLAMVASSVLSVENLWKRWWLTFLAVSGLVCLHGIAQILCAGQACGAPGAMFEIHQGGSRVDASFGNAAYLPGYLLFGIAIALWQGIERSGALRFALFALAAVQTLVLIFTATRGAFLGLLGAITLGGILWLVETKGMGRKIAIGTLGIVLLLAGGLFLARDTAFVTQSPVLERLSSAFNVESLEVRFAIWNMAVSGALERPLAGWGQEGFNYVFAKHYDPSLYEQEPWFDRAHNVFLDWLVAGGFPALLLFLALLISIVRALYTRSFSKAERVTLICALAAYGIQGLAVFDNLFTYVPLFMIAAMVHSRASTPIASSERLPILATPTAQGVAASVVGVVALVTLWFVNVPSMQAGSDLIYALSSRAGSAEGSLEYFKKAVDRNPLGSQEIAEQLMIMLGNIVRAPGVSDATKQEFVNFAFSQMANEIVRAPADPRLRLQLASGYASIGDFTNAVAQVEEALRLSPNKQTTWIQLGAILWQGGNMQGARTAFRKAYELDPSFPMLASYAAAGDIALGEIYAGKALLVEAFGTTTVDSEPLRIAYFQAKLYDDLVAIEQLRVKKAEGRPEARFALAQLYATIGRKDDAIREIQQTITLYPETANSGAFLLDQIQKATTTGL